MPYEISSADSAGSTPLRRQGWRVRLSAALRQWSLDDRLLAGDDPGTDPKLTERAAKLTGPQHRLELAQALRHLLVDASRRREVGPSRMSLRRREILGAREQLLALADDLETREPTGVRGVILASRLLSQGDSPVYFRCADETVGDAARHARTALQLG
jgi:hypothetical protein